jgi:hypothetical protein
MSRVGFIKDWRQELESDIWLMPPMYHRVWQWLKYSANHSQGKIPNSDGTFTVINPGQCATSYRLIAQGVGYYEGRTWREPNVKTVKVILCWLVKQGMIHINSNTKGSIITIKNWELYQSKDVEGNSDRITEETPKKRTLDTKKNDKECIKNDKNIYSDLPLELHKPVKDFIENRKALKKPMTDRAIELMLKKLHSLSGGDIQQSIKILEQSIEHGWIGIFPLKDAQQTTEDVYAKIYREELQNEQSRNNKNYENNPVYISGLLQD